MENVVNLLGWPPLSLIADHLPLRLKVTLRDCLPLKPSSVFAELLVAMVTYRNHCVAGVEDYG